LKIIAYIFVFLLACFSFASANLEYELAEDIKDNRLDDFSHIEAAFILSGATNADTLHYYLDWYNELLQTIENFNLDRIDRVGSAGKVFSYLHSTLLKKYKEQATTLLNVVHEKRFNCVAGTILYNLLCEDLGWPTEAFETPTHTYTIFPNFTEQIMVENTSVMGFDIMRNLNEYSRYLLQFYPQQQRLKIGLDRIYAYENSKGRQINNTELLGLLAYNRAYFSEKEGNYAKAYDFVTLAQSFNRDSRSNINFEIGLYYKWGKKLFDQKSFYNAFQVFADAYYRYWENDDFAKNCKISFFNAQRQTWQKKNWRKSSQLTADMLDLDLLSDDDLTRLENMLLGWGQFFLDKNLSNETRDVLAYLNEINPKNPQTKKLGEAVEKF
jgi:hypothetical protein